MGCRRRRGWQAGVSSVGDPLCSLQPFSLTPMHAHHIANTNPTTNPTSPTATYNPSPTHEMGRKESGSPDRGKCCRRWGADVGGAQRSPSRSHRQWGKQRWMGVTRTQPTFPQSNPPRVATTSGHSCILKCKKIYVNLRFSASMGRIHPKPHGGVAWALVTYPGKDVRLNRLRSDSSPFCRTFNCIKKKPTAGKEILALKRK